MTLMSCTVVGELVGRLMAGCGGCNGGLYCCVVGIIMVCAV